jgi:hypothetical protein
LTYCILFAASSNGRRNSVGSAGTGTSNCEDDWQLKGMQMSEEVKTLKAKLASVEDKNTMVSPEF